MNQIPCPNCPEKGPGGISIIILYTNNAVRPG